MGGFYCQVMCECDGIDKQCQLISLKEPGGLEISKNLINAQKLIFSWSSLGFPKNATLKANRDLATTLKQRLGIKE